MLPSVIFVLLMALAAIFAGAMISDKELWIDDQGRVFEPDDMPEDARYTKVLVGKGAYLPDADARAAGLLGGEGLTMDERRLLGMGTTDSAHPIAGDASGSLSHARPGEAPNLIARNLPEADRAAYIKMAAEEDAKKAAAVKAANAKLAKLRGDVKADADAGDVPAERAGRRSRGEGEGR